MIYLLDLYLGNNCLDVCYIYTFNNLILITYLFYKYNSLLIFLAVKTIYFSNGRLLAIFEIDN